MLTVTVKGAEAPIDINDDAQIMAACEALGAASLQRIHANNHTKALKALLTGLHYWLIKDGAQLVMARIGGHDGIGLEAALSSHNWITRIIGEDQLELPPGERPQDASQSGDPSGASSGRDAQGSEAVLVDAQGRPIPPGQQELLGAEGSEL